MDKVIINSYEEFEKLVGQQIGVSDWLEIPQERINQFADATLDHQWIHVDAERAKVESPYKSTIVHGYLTLSLLPHLWNEIWTGCIVWTKCTSGSLSAFSGESAWSCQG